MRAENPPQTGVDDSIVSARRLPVASNLAGDNTGGLFLRSEHPGCESFRQNGSENGSGEREDEHRVEQRFVQQSLASGIDGVIRDKGCGERGSDLGQGQRPYRQSCRRQIVKGATHDYGSNPFSQHERDDDSDDQWKADDDAMLFACDTTDDMGADLAPGRCHARRSPRRVSHRRCHWPETAGRNDAQRGAS
jgi:hypothetical protein